MKRVSATTAVKSQARLNFAWAEITEATRIHHDEDKPVAPSREGRDEIEFRNDARTQPDADPDARKKN